LHLTRFKEQHVRTQAVNWLSLKFFVILIGYYIQYVTTSSSILTSVQVTVRSLVVSQLVKLATFLQPANVTTVFKPRDTSLCPEQLSPHYVLTLRSSDIHFCVILVPRKEQI